MIGQNQCVRLALTLYAFCEDEARVVGGRGGFFVESPAQATKHAVKVFS
jgi:hypothetical protein